MTMITYGVTTPSRDGSACKTSGRKSIFRRFLDALYESRMRQAQREINRHLYLVPNDALRQAGYKVSVKHNDVQPFRR